MNSRKKTLLLSIILSALFTASTSVAQPIRGPVDASLDPVNQQVVARTLAALSIRLELSGDTVTVHEVRLTRIPVSRAVFSVDASRIIIRAYDQSPELVGRTSVSDRRMNARDGVAVVLDDRSVSVIVPLVGRPDHIEITPPNTVMPQRFSVKEEVQEFCDDYGGDPICSGDPPRSNPEFDLLAVPDP